MRLKSWTERNTNGHQFRVGMSLAVGLIWTSVALGDGPLFPGARYAAGDLPESVAIGDLNGDEVPDLVVPNIHSHTVSVLLGVGDGMFAARVPYAARRWPFSVAIGDLDGDEVPDLAAANSSGNVAVLLGIGDGTFVAAVYHAAGDAEGPRSVAIGDLNGDQMADLAVANRAGNVAVLLGAGDGMFAAAVHYATGDVPRSVAIGDLNGDQVPDLTVANAVSDNVSVLLGIGDGTFAAAVHYATGNTPLSVAIGDRKADLAVAHAVFGGVSVLPGVGDGTFAATLEYAADNWSFSVAIGDLDGDQVPDLAVANSSSNNISVLLNQSFRDCNDNGTPDDCDIDCGPPGGPCDRPGCGESKDCDANGEPDDCEVDFDTDGFFDDCDACVDSDLANLIAVGECPTGVTNDLLDDGCTMNDVLTECSVGADSHGELPAFVARHANEWRRQGLLSGKDVGRIAHCAGTVSEHGPSKRIKDVRSHGRRRPNA